MLLTFHYHMKLLAAQSKQRSLSKLACFRAQPLPSYHLQRWYHRCIVPQRLQTTFRRSKLSQASVYAGRALHTRKYELTHDQIM